MASIVARPPTAVSAATGSIGGVEFNAPFLIKSKYMAQVATATPRNKKLFGASSSNDGLLEEIPSKPVSVFDQSIWERSQNPDVDADGLNQFERAAEIRREMRSDPRLQILKMLSDGRPKKLRERDDFIGLIEQEEVRTGIRPRQDIRNYGPGSDASRFTEGMDERDASYWAGKVASANQISEMLQKSIEDFEKISKKDHSALYTSDDGSERMRSVLVNDFKERHFEGFHNTFRQSLEKYKTDPNFGDLHQKDLFDPFGTPLGYAQSLIVASAFADYVESEGIELDMLEYGGLARQRETVMAIREELVRRGKRAPVLVCNSNNIELGFADSGVSQIGIVNKDDAFFRDPATLANMTFTEDKEHIYNRIEAEQTEKMEAIKQIADWKMKRGLGQIRDADGNIIHDTTVNTFKAISCEHSGDEDEYLRGQGGAYARQGNCEIRHSQYTMNLSADGSKYIHARGNLYDDTVIEPGFQPELFKLIFGESKNVLGHKDADCSAMAWRTKDGEVIPSMPKQIKAMWDAKIAETRTAMETIDNDFLRADLLEAMGASSMEPSDLTDAKIRTFFERPMQPRAAGSISVQSASSRGSAVSSTGSAVSRDRETDTATASNLSGHDSADTRLSESTPAKGAARLMQNF